MPKLTDQKESRPKWIQEKDLMKADKSIIPTTGWNNTSMKAFLEADDMAVIRGAERMAKEMMDSAIPGHRASTPPGWAQFFNDVPRKFRQQKKISTKQLQGLRNVLYRVNYMIPRLVKIANGKTEEVDGD